MGRVKHRRYAEAQTLPNIFMVNMRRFDPPEPDVHWDASFFKTSGPVTAELGCGKGEYTVAMARAFPHRNFIGIDVKSDRMWRGAKTALDEGLSNVCFIRLRVEHLPAFFPPAFFDEAWIPFPDPHLSQPSGRRRLTSLRYLDIYRKIMKPQGALHLKTDNRVLYDYSVEAIAEGRGNIRMHTDDLYGSSLEIDAMAAGIQTTFEQRYLRKGIPIKYICFTL